MTTRPTITPDTTDATDADVAALAAVLASYRTPDVAAVLADPSAYRTLAMTGSGTVTTGKTAPWQVGGPGAGNDLWALCYAVASNGGRAVSDYQRKGCAWGFARTRKTADADVADKRKHGNGAVTVKRGSVFATPAYVVPVADVPLVTNALAMAYGLWVAALPTKS